MIAEAGVLSTSPWNSDTLLKEISSDVFKSFLNTNDGLDLVFPMIDLDSRSGIESLEQDFSSSCSRSSTSSECSDELSLDVLSSHHDVLCMTDHDYLNSSLNLLDDESMTACAPFFDWRENLFSSSSFLNEDAGSEVAPDTHILSSPKQKRNASVDPVMDTTLWSRMALNEQLEAVQNLTNIISVEMGLREQLDIIRIIDPDAVISATDTEFVIDISALNDIKLCRVKEYVRKALAGQKESWNHKRSPARSGLNSASSKCNTSTSTAGKSNAGPATVKSKSKSVKKKEAKEKRVAQKVVRERLKKENRQIQKERRSGLFAREEVLALCTPPYVEEETDIDILG